MEKTQVNTATARCAVTMLLSKQPSAHMTSAVGPQLIGTQSIPATQAGSSRQAATASPQFCSTHCAQDESGGGRMQPEVL